MLYYLHELNHAAFAPMRMAASMGLNFWQSPANPAAKTPFGRSMAAGLEVFERVSRRYGKPEFAIDRIETANGSKAVCETVVKRWPFCDLVRFTLEGRKQDRPALLMVAPMSGHYATLLRGTVETMLADFDVYITDWVDARVVPVSKGRFDLDDYVDYIIEMLRFTGPGTHIMAVCQPSVPVLAAVSVMNANDDEAIPASMSLLGGPIDTRSNPTAVNDLAEKRGIDWFERNVIVHVPFPHAGFMRRVYPGFLQLTGFMTMNLDRHFDAHKELFWNLVKGDDDSASRHDRFYDEYLSVMDLTAEFYLQTVDEVFIRHSLPKGEFFHRGERVDPGTITKTALMTVEGELDDITGIGQTRAAHDICTGLAADKKNHYMQKGVGHYGVFNGRKFRRFIAPELASFMRKNEKL